MLTGIILAGGDQQRMRGELKSLLPLSGEMMIHRQIREMSTLCNEIIVVTNTPRPFMKAVDTSVRIITDFIPGKGPLSGMHAGLTLMENESGWIVGCDMPFLSAKAAALMKQVKEEFAFEAIVPRINGRLEMLHGIYNKVAGDSIKSLLNTGDQRPEQLLHFLRWSEVDADQFIVAGIDTRFTYAMKTRDDYHRLLLEDLRETGHN